MLIVKSRNRQCHLYNCIVVGENWSLFLTSACVCDSASVYTSGDRLQNQVESGTRQCNKTGVSFTVKNFSPFFFFFFTLFCHLVTCSGSPTGTIISARFYLSRRVTWWKNKIKERRKKQKCSDTCFEWLGETATDATVWKDDRVAAPDHHGPEWPTQHVTVLFSRITKSTGESSSFRVNSFFKTLSTSFVFWYNRVINVMDTSLNRYLSMTSININEIDRVVYEFGYFELC